MPTALLIALVLCADAGTPEPLDGVWELDLKASSDLTPLFDLLDVGAFKRGIAAGVVTTQTVKLTPEQMELTVSSTFKSGTKRWALDGKDHMDDELFGSPTRVTSRYENGMVLSAGTLTVKGKAITMTVKRFVENGVMVQESVFAPEGQKPFTVRRVFRKKS